MPTSNAIRSTQYQQFRAEMKKIWQAENRACGICLQADIDWDGDRNQPDSFELDHIVARKLRPDLVLAPNNAQPTHVKCNRSKGARAARPTLGENTETW